MNKRGFPAWVRGQPGVRFAPRISLVKDPLIHPIRSSPIDRISHLPCHTLLTR